MSLNSLAIGAAWHGRDRQLLRHLVLKESKEIVDFKSAPSDATDRTSPIASTTTSLWSSTGNTDRHVEMPNSGNYQFLKDQTSISGVERPQVVQEICRKLNIFNNLNDLQLRGKFLMNRSLYYCDIPKCGSAFMEQFLSGTFQCDGLCDEMSITSNELRSRTIRVMGNAYSFMFVREPYARLFSAYENKLFLPNEHWKIIGTDVINTIRPHASRVSKMLGHDVTFLELVKYVLNLYERRVRLNDHLSPMYMHCDTCEFRFNFIGKLETMSSDLVDLVEDWKTKGIVPTSKNMSAAEEIEAKMLYKRSFGPYRHMFTTLKRYGEMLSRYNFFQRAWSSYQIRGLILKKYNMPFAEYEVAKVSYAQFGAEIKKALDASMGHKDELKAQREEALVQAYSSVPMDLMLKLKEFMKPDCLLFGYDDMPKLLFNRANVKTSVSYNYFKGL
ncbi:uncharacterized protein LOC123550094 isoform X2 [Mercenaria mercenaria]|uniref:uncharacterized protein LOC123550094 isoform X2 n=1 Tax=Mercenaria mercenaria TaxID=6596 RepID=UPI00234F113C|nr:uncharacterized protein LOC123550094 isoform X2 [Mercenaria mercenaria]